MCRRWRWRAHAPWPGRCLSKAQRRTRTARRALAARGFNECVSFLLHRPRARPALFGGGDDARQLSNPIASDLDALRPSVLPSLLAAAARNAARGFANLQLFEIGAGFRQRHAGSAEDRRRGYPHRPSPNAIGRRAADAAGLFDGQGRPAGGAGSDHRRADVGADHPRRARLVSSRAAAAPSRWGPK